MSQGSSDEGSQPQADRTASQNGGQSDAQGELRPTAEPVPAQTELAPESQEDDLDAGWEELLGDALQDRPTRSLRGATDPSRTRTSVSMRAPTLPHVAVVAESEAPGSSAPTSSDSHQGAPQAPTAAAPVVPGVQPQTPSPAALAPRSEGPAQEADTGAPAAASVAAAQFDRPPEQPTPTLSRGLLAVVGGLTSLAAVAGYLWLSGSQPEASGDSQDADSQELAANEAGRTQDARSAGLLPEQDPGADQQKQTAKTSKSGQAQPAGEKPDQTGQAEPAKDPAAAADTAEPESDKPNAVAEDGKSGETDADANAGQADTAPEDDGKLADAQASDSESAEDPAATELDPDGAGENAVAGKKAVADDGIPPQRIAPPGTPKANARALQRIPLGPDDEVPLGGIGRSGIHVDKAGFGNEYKEYTCQGENEVYSLSKRHKAHLCVRLVHGKKSENVTIRWLRKGKQVASKKVRVPGKRHVAGAYDVFKFRKGKHKPGPWSVVVQSSRGVELLRYDFRVRR